MKKLALILSAVLLLAQAVPAAENENSVSSGDITAAAGAVTAAEGALASDTWTCPECGQTDNTGKFCSGCGKPRA